MLVGIGAFILLFTTKKKAKDIAGIMVGMGVLFYGMTPSGSYHTEIDRYLPEAVKQIEYP